VQEDNYTQTFWSQNIMQFWTDEEIPLSDDKMSWIDLSPPEQDVYKRVLGGLTLLDTVQGHVGMFKILEKVDNLQQKSTLSFMGMMENIHAKSYSSIFTTLASSEEITEIFDWVEQNKYLQRKANIIGEYYGNIRNKRDLYMAMVASVLLESYLFYSGFFYPLYLSGQGKMSSSGEIIDLILRDESIHGVYIGQLAQDIFKEFPKRVQDRIKTEVYELLDELNSNETAYTKELYEILGLQDEVIKFTRYNANKAFQNLGFDPPYPEEEINPIVQNGLSTKTKQHDFFSRKGNGYVRAANVEKMRDEDFIFNR
jgi:ribonucleoside-diphosphate reductase beta chain